MSALLVGYARCSTDQQDLTAQRDGLPWLDGDRNIVQHRVLFVGERHIAEFHLPTHVLNGDRVLVIRQFIRRIKHFKHPPPRRRGALHHVVHTLQRLHRAEQSPPVGAKCQQFTQPKLPAGHD